MENCFLQQHHFGDMVSLPSSLSSSPSSSLKPHLRFFTKKHVGGPFLCLRQRPMKVKASAGKNHCEFSSLNTPLEPRSQVGKFLSGVLQNHRNLFHIVAIEELRLLSDDKESAIARMHLSQDSDEALLHRRIAQLKENECKISIEDVMYMLILYKFSEIRVPLVPKLSNCVYNGRLEILPSKEWELESIHNMNTLDIVREHVSFVTRLKADSSVNESWATTEIRQSWLARVYVASILYGYFLKSASLRYHLEKCLSLSDHDLHIDHRTGMSFRDVCPGGSKDVIFGNRSDIKPAWYGLIKEEEEIGDLKCYVRGFHPIILRRCAKLRSEEAVHLVESHSHALFANEESSLNDDSDDNGDGDFILTSFSSVRRLILEAHAFGSFLWEAEDYIENVYKLKDHEAV